MNIMRSQRVKNISSGESFVLVLENSNVLLFHERTKENNLIKSFLFL